MEHDEVIEVYQEQTEGGADEAKTECIKQVVGHDSKTIYFTVKMTTQMRKFISYSGQVIISVASLRFRIDVKRINNDETPKSFWMERENTIEVCQEQLIGAQMGSIKKNQLLIKQKMVLWTKQLVLCAR